MNKKVAQILLGTAIFVTAAMPNSRVVNAAVQNGWEEVDGKRYWYENGVKQGYDANNPNYRGKEIYDPGTNAWYWLDNVQGGAVATGKDVYQESQADAEGNIGKWVRYDENGHMIKGWATDENGTYYFDLTYGTMLKGSRTIDGVDYYFNEATGILESCSVGFDNHWVTIDGVEYWYEGGIRQGYDPIDASYRGKEIYDPASNAWYWLDNVQGGAKAVNKDVYQESFAGEYADREDGTGKWVRYDSNGHMIKGWNEQNGSNYYFDPITGAMAKGTVVINGARYTFNTATGTLETPYRGSGCNLPESSSYYKYEYAYRNNDTSGLAEEDMTFYNTLKEYLDYAYQFAIPFEQEKAIHDYMVLNCAYDYDNFFNDTIPWESGAPEGVFVHKTAVCQGYAEAFKLCMDILGIECIMVTGEAGSESHAWNAVKLDGEWYMIDVTWDDPVPDEEGRLLYNYFNIPDWIMKLDHTYDCEIQANSIRYSGVEVLETTNDVAMDNLNASFERALNNSTQDYVLRVYVTKPDGTDWTEEEFTTLNRQMTRAELDVRYGYAYKWKRAVKDGAVACFTFQGGDIKEYHVTTDTPVAEVEAYIDRLYQELELYEKFAFFVEKADGTAFQRETEAAQAASALMGTANTRCSYVQVQYIDGSKALVLYRKYHEDVQVLDYHITDAQDVSDIDIEALRQYLDEKAEELKPYDWVVIRLAPKENGRWTNPDMENIDNQCISASGPFRSSMLYFYEDGSVAIGYRRVQSE